MRSISVPIAGGEVGKGKWQHFIWMCDTEDERRELNPGFGDRCTVKETKKSYLYVDGWEEFITRPAK